MGDRDRIICNSQQKQFVNERSCCSYCAHIGRVIKKEEGPHYIIDGNSNLRHNGNCLLNTCFGNTTVRRKIKVEAVTDDDDAKGAHVANALRVDAGIGVSKHIRQESTARCNRSREGLSRSIHKDRLFD